MDARFYNSEEIDIEQLANNLENIYRAQGYQAQQIGNRDQMMVQLKKGSDFEALIGMQAALSVIMQRSGGGVIAMIGQQKWIDKAAIGAVGIIAAPVLWPLMLTAGAGAIRQASLGNQVLNVVDGLVRQQQPGIQVGPIPVQVMPQLQQQYSPPPQYIPPPAYTPPPQVVNALPNPAPTARNLRCPNCNTPYEPGDTFCTGCGKPLVTLCPNCKTEIKDGASFCPKCGSSVYQAPSTTQAAPAQSPSPTVQYTTSQTQQAPAPMQPEPQPYVPPVPQEPPVMPPTRITISPSANRQDQPAPPKPQPQPEVYYTPPADLPPAPTARQEVYYTPQANPQPAPSKPQAPKKQEEVYYTPPPDLQANLPKTQQAPPVRPQPLAPKPGAQSANNSAATWGYLTFSDGKQIKLSGERALVGRYDHDLGGTQPEVDLSAAQGSDTVSRIHAALEHSGSSYTLTDLNSTNSTRLNGKRLEPDKAAPINDGDTLTFGKVTCTFKKA
ncbi:MAG: zinc-ribbon domain-containing protein [Ktedonobacteraceae bacterium]